MTLPWDTHESAEVERRQRFLDTMEYTQPKVSRVFGDENAGVIMGAVTQAMKEVGRAINADPREVHEACNTVRLEMMAGDYEHLREVARRYIRFDGEE